MKNILKKKFDDEESDTLVMTYKSNFQFSDYDIEDSKLIEKIEQREKVLRNNMIKDVQARLEIAKSLSEIQELLSNHKNGTFLAYLEYVGMKKDMAYDLIKYWKIYQKTNSMKVFELPNRVVTKINQEMKANQDIEVEEIIEIVEAENPKEILQELKEKRINEVQKKNATGTKEKELEKIEKRLTKLFQEIAELEEKKKKLLNE